MNPWLTFSIGVFMGSVAGYILACLMMSAGKDFSLPRNKCDLCQVLQDQDMEGRSLEASDRKTL